MDRVELCRKVGSATRRVLVVNDEKVVRAGAGVTVSDLGVVLTASHVVCDDSGSVPGQVVVGTDDSGFVRYRSILSCDYALATSEKKGLSEDIEIDLNVLLPTANIPDQAFLPLSGPGSEVGETVIMAGYPDEMVMQTRPEKMVDYGAFEETPSRMDRELISESFKAQMLKRGMIGNVQRLRLKNIQVSEVGIRGSISIIGAYYGIDTHLSEGGSGGPVVNAEGEVIGVVIKRGKTETDMELVPILPAGTGLVVSHSLVSWVLRYIRRVEENGVHKWKIGTGGS